MLSGEDGHLEKVHNTCWKTEMTPISFACRQWVELGTWHLWRPSTHDEYDESWNELSQHLDLYQHDRQASRAAPWPLSQLCLQFLKHQQKLASQFSLELWNCGVIKNSWGHEFGKFGRRDMCARVKTRTRPAMFSRQLVFFIRIFAKSHATFCPEFKLCRKKANS